MSQDPSCDYVDPDIAECELGEKVGEAEEYKRKHADDRGVC
ncbi:hypothetical protein LCGC14_2819870 [marine sediment metagenome]|uniref:Uncharacterized protein n=1 Tax=marine sediment metagenome TaxID=412755 RepID=A0A0F9B8I9_9ZZZZ